MRSENKKIESLVGTKVTLKPLHESFFDEYHRMFSPTVRAMLHLTQTAPIEETRKFLSGWLKTTKVDEKFFFCIFDNQDQCLIGALEIREPDCPNGQMGAWLNENYWGGGRYQEALGLALNWYSAYTGRTTVGCMIDVRNARSLRAHQKYGFVIVGEKMFEGRRLYCLEHTKINV